MVNDDQSAAWDGDTGRHWVAEAERYTRMLQGFSARIIEALQPRDGERLLDVGCGNGDLSLELARLVAPGGNVVGVDLSAGMLDVARRRAGDRSIDNAVFVQGDAQVYAFDTGAFDACVSRFGTMFFDDPVAAFRNVARSLKPGGRVAFACWRDLAMNDWAIVPGAAALQHVPLPDMSGADGPGPFSFADAERVQHVLTSAGLRNVEIREVREPMRMGSSVDDAVAFLHEHEFAQVLMKDAPPAAADRAWLAIREALEPYSTDDGVVLDGTAWLVAARRA